MQSFLGPDPAFLMSQTCPYACTEGTKEMHQRKPMKAYVKKSMLLGSAWHGISARIAR